MTSIDRNATLGQLVAERPARAALFERLGMDYCCGGGHTLEQACAPLGLDHHTVAAMLEALADAPGQLSAGEVDWREATIGELVDHIVAVHHDGLRRDLPRIDELLAKVVRVHGPAELALNDVRRVFDGLRAELESHLETEERDVFPAARAVEHAGAGPAEELLAGHEAEHRQVGDALTRLRELTAGYDPQRARCNTHRALLDSLQALELDLHQHVHEENNLLFPRVRELSAAAAGVKDGPHV